MCTRLSILLVTVMVSKAGAATIQTFLSTYVADTIIQRAQSDDQNYNDTVTSKTTTVSYSSNTVFSGGSSQADVQANLGTQRLAVFDSYVLNGSVSYAESSAEVLIDDRGHDTNVAPGAPDFLKPQMVLSGTSSPFVDLSSYLIELTVTGYTLDVTQNISDSFYFSTEGPNLNHDFTGIYGFGGDIVQTSLSIRMDAYQAGNAPFSSAFLDYLHTIHFYIDSTTPGARYLSDTGFDYTSPAAVPEPAAGWLLAGGAMLLAGLRRRRTAL